MNPVFVFLVILGAIILWFLLSFAFVPLGNILYKKWKNAIDNINKEDTTKESEEKE